MSMQDSYIKTQSEINKLAKPNFYCPQNDNKFLSEQHNIEENAS